MCLRIERRGTWRIASFIFFAGLVAASSAEEPLRRSAKPPSIEDYATIESVCNGVPVYSFGNLIHVYGQSPDFFLGSPVQKDNRNPPVKIKPKKSWEIKHNYAGSEHEMTVRSRWTDSHPTLPIHLIDGDPETVWSSWGCAVPTGRPEWIRIDLPLEAQVASVVLACSKEFAARYPPHGKALPKQIEVRLSRDGATWETVYQSKSFAGNPSGRTEIKFAPQRAKLVWLVAENLPEKAPWIGHVFSLAWIPMKGIDLKICPAGWGGRKP